MSASPAGSDAMRDVLATGPRPAAPGVLSTCAAFGWRGLLKVRRVPEQLIDVTIGPVVLLVLFTYLFGGAISGSSGAYLQSLLPAILVQAVLFTSLTSGLTLNADRTTGVVDRFRSLPIWQPAPFVGSVLADALRYVLAGTVVVLMGLVLGYEAEGGLLGVIAGASLVIVFAFALSWIFTTAGLLVRSPTALQGTAMTAMFVLIFLSNALVDPATLPRALQAFVELNPASHLITAVRGLLGGTAEAADVLLVLGEALLLLAVFAPLTARLYGRT
jgi:ABC-2 type transport system permease protein